MADDKTKRLRTHVVKELFETEADYTDHLEFTVTVCPSFECVLQLMYERRPGD